MRINLISCKILIFLILTSLFSFGATAKNVKTVQSLTKSSAKSQAKPKPQTQTQAQEQVASENQFPEPPQIAKDEYAIFLEDSYKVFKTKKIEELELSMSCFKNNKPKCQAYEFGQIKPKNLEVKYEGFNNLAAIHCNNIGGKNLLALDQKRNHYNFCQFSDKSLVNSWSMYFKHIKQ